MIRCAEMRRPYHISFLIVSTFDTYHFWTVSFLVRIIFDTYHFWYVSFLSRIIFDNGTNDSNDGSNSCQSDR